MPKMNVWDLEFSDEELADWHQELERRKNLILGAKSIHDIPLAEHYAGGKNDRNWPCKNCALKGTVCTGGGGERLPFFPELVDMGVKDEAGQDRARQVQRDGLE